MRQHPTIRAVSRDRGGEYAKAARLGLSDRTVQRWQAAKIYPEVKRRRKRRSTFDAFAPEVLKRWQAGERNGQALWQAIKALGYTGSERTVYRYLEPLKQAVVRATINPQRLEKFSAKTAVWLFVRDPTTLDEVEREDLAAWCQVSATLKQAYRLVQDFLVMVHQREGQRLDAWLEKVESLALPELQSFAARIEQDKEAVQAGLISTLSNAQTEGQVTKVKLIKRQMYGRDSGKLKHRVQPTRVSGAASDQQKDPHDYYRMESGQLSHPSRQRRDGWPSMALISMPRGEGHEEGYRGQALYARTR